MPDASCLCGAVTIAIKGPLERLSACHCTQCRKHSGHYWAATTMPLTQITYSGPVTWFRSSPAAQRGFCATCGSTLFWKPDGQDHMSISLGLFDTATGITPGPNGLTHIFTASKGDYYDLPPDEAQDP
ncbi:GFA family protein [Celeribacter arenosi]|uniref:GFA family protein n=1 Tax=Celeribacter arenosi TaxID=792649 RepID=A0ABP7KC39_9RHOB